MKTNFVRFASPVVVSCLAFALQGCSSSTVVPPTVDASPGTDAATSDGGTSALKWYATCGYPVCMTDTGDGGSADAGLTTEAGAPCPSVGTACSTKGDGCGTPSNFNCGSTLVCDDHDPTMGGGGCPISSRAFKQDINYVTDADLARLHDETLRIKLATYEYKSAYGNPNEKHLGFIIEDQPQSASVDGARDRVDMYGYLSMVVATMKVQEKEIADLRRELATTRSTCEGPARPAKGK